MVLRSNKRHVIDVERIIEEQQSDAVDATENWMAFYIAVTYPALNYITPEKAFKFIDKKGNLNMSRWRFRDVEGKEQMVFRYICDHFNRFMRPPTIREITHATSITNVRKYLLILQSKKRIRLLPYSSRNIEILDKSHM